MRANRSLNGITILALALSLGACSKRDNKNNDRDPNAGRVTTKKEFREKYQFELNGCTTGKQEFTSDSYGDVARQLCEALQNEELNRRCAQPLRKNFFDKKCSGIAWNPVYPEPSRPSQPANPAPSQPDRDLAKEREVRDALSYLLADSYEVTEGLNTIVAKFADTLSADMKSCGFSYVGPKCMNYHAYAGSYEGTMFDPKGESIFMTDLRFDGINVDILFAFRIKDENGISSDELMVYVKNQDKQSNQSIKEYLESAAVQLISIAKISEDFIATAKERVQSPQSLKELYHMAHQLNELNMKSSSPDSNLSSFLVKCIVDNKSQFNSSDEVYQYRTYSLAESLGAKKVALVSIAEGLLASSSEQIKQFAATEILQRDSSRKNLKTLVTEALNHSRWTTRRKAIQALVSAKPTEDEQNAILLKMNDDVREVREAALAATSSINLNGTNLKTLQTLSNSQYWTTRRSSAALLAQVSGKKATDLLIGKMSDDVREVREEVFTQLNSRTIGEDSLETLGSQFDSQYWTVRRDVAKLVGKSQAQKATDLLIGKMSDNVREVREEIMVQLSARSLNENSLSGLEAQSKSQFWTVRRDTASLISKISSDNAVKALITLLSDDVREVREKAAELLSSKPMKDAFVRALQTQLVGQYWTSRREAARLLGKIKTDSSLDALIARLQVETVHEVRDAISDAISAIRG
jgi:HEAT repeat protein